MRISDIEQMVFEKLISKKQKLTARAYEGYRSIREFQREENELDDVIYGIVEGTDKEVLDENSTWKLIVKVRWAQYYLMIYIN